MSTHGRTPKDFLQKSLQGAKITKKTKLIEIIENVPDAGEILFETGMCCFGCPMAQQETLEQGCLAHGISKEEIEKLVKRLNKE